MIWRHLCLARAFAASGFLLSTTLGLAMAGEPSDPTPEAETPIETVKVLDAEKAGMLAVEVRGSGAESVQVLLRNQSGKKLKVILPPGLVASNATGQGAAGGGGAGGGGGFQNMGLGAAGNQAGGFGQFAGNKPQSGFRSIGVSADSDASTSTVTVPVGKSVDFSVPAVCLNFGAPTPTSKNRFRLVDIDDYSTDARVRKSLRTLATLGTSHGVAQAAMWRVCDNLSFDDMLARGGKLINPSEVALAARFLKAIDSGSEFIDLDTARVFVTISGDSASAKDAARLSKELDGLRILGLPVRVVARGEIPQASAPIIHLGVTLASGDSHETRGKVVVQAGEGVETLDWTTLGTARFEDLSAPSSLDAASLARAIDRAVGSTFVTAKVARRSANGTTLEIRNRLPFTVANVTVKAGASPASPMVDVLAVGVGPGRSGQTTIPASTGSVERVELNGL